MFSGIPLTYADQPILIINDQPASNRLIEDILQISVEESLHLPGMFTIVINNPYLSGRERDEPVWEHQKLFKIGGKIEIGFVSSSTQRYKDIARGGVLKGEITAIEAHFNSGSQAPIIIQGYDISHRLHRGRHNRSFQNMTDSDIVQKIAKDVGIPINKVDATGSPHKYIFQENQTNMEFLRERAARNGFEFFIQDGKLNFCKANSDRAIELEWLNNLHSFRVRVSSAEQVSTVQVRGWDYTQKHPIVETVSSEKVLTKTKHGEGSATSQIFADSPAMIVVDQPVFAATEARKIAQGLCDELGGEFVCADAKAVGNPHIRPGRVVKLKGNDMGAYNGEYYVTETRHLFHERLYTTEFSVRGLRGGDLLSILSPQNRLKAGQTLLVGVVTNNNDPENLSRVRVKLPTLTEEHESNWARVVSIGSGPNRGFDCLPEINDEVLVGFEHGDIHRPYVIGNVWNGKDRSPDHINDSLQEGKVRLRTFKTRTGHSLQFVEEDKGSSKKGIYLDTVYGHHIYCNDTEQWIEIKTKNGHQVHLDDKNKKITIKTQGGHTYELNDTSRSITMSSTGSIKISAATSIEIDAAKIALKSTANTDITASGMVNVKGALIKLN
jgi:phage protein D